VLPMSLVVYVMGTPLRRKERVRQADLATQASGREPDTSGHATGLPQDGAVPPVRKEPD
jgi:hypothetical protein